MKRVMRWRSHRVPNFKDHVKWSDFVITVEGKLDSQTFNNKALKTVADVARKYNKPVEAMGGSVQKEASGPSQEFLV